jgi:hypothetical protein
MSKKLSNRSVSPTVHISERGRKYLLDLKKQETKHENKRYSP